MYNYFIRITLHHISRLGLTKIISLVPETPVSDLVNFCSLANIKLYHFNLPRNAFLNSTLINQFVSIIMILLDTKRSFRQPYEKYLIWSKYVRSYLPIRHIAWICKNN